MERQNSVDKLADALVRHQIRLIRLAVGTGRQLTTTLNAFEQEVQRVLETRIDKIARPHVFFGKGTRKTLTSVIKALDTLQNPMWKEIEAKLRKELLEVARMEVGFIATATEAALPVVVATQMVEARTLRRLTFNEPIDGATLNQWTKDIRRADRRRFIQAIQVGLANGESGSEIGRRVFGTIGDSTTGRRQLTRNALTGLAQTSINAVTNRARSEFYARNRDIFSAEIFVATLDARTTPVCRATDGKEFPIGQGLTPPLHFNCRSLRIPKLNSRRLATRPASGAFKGLLEGTKGPERRRLVEQLTGQVPAETTYAQFLKRQTVGFQNEVMGVTKARLFRRGGLDLDKFINPAGRELTLVQLRRAHPDAFERAGL